MKKLILFLQLVACGIICKAQTPNWLWAESGPGNGYGYCSDIAIGPNDTVYIAGRTGGNLSLGNLSLNTGSTIPFVGKYDSSGGTNNNGIWLSDNYPISTFAYSDALCVDGAGSSYITSCDGSGNSIFVEKYNTHGNLSWYSNYFGGNNRGYGISTDKFGNVYSSGNFSSTMQMGSVTLPYSGGSWAGYLLKQDTAGNVKWATYFASGSNYVGGRRCATDIDGNVYVVGSYKGSALFYSADLTTFITANPSAGGGGLGDLFVAKYDSSGNILWVQNVPHAGLYDNMYYYANSIVVDSCGNFYVAGIFDGTATFGSLPAVTPTGGFDAFVAKFNTSSMTWEWVQTGDGPGGSNNYSGNISLDKTSDVYLCGSYNGGSITFGSTTVSAGNNFITKFSNSNGAVQYVIDANINSGGISGVAVDANNYLYVDGSYGGTSTLGTATLTGGGGSVFLAKLDTIPPRTIVPSLSGSYCPGSTVSLPYTITGIFNSGNVFTAQLSDSSGSFVNAVNIGDTASTTGGTITIIIPANTPAGTTYLIRVISSSPATSSYANGCGAYFQNNVYPNDFYITIGGGGKIPVIITSVPANDSICKGGSATLTVSGGTSYLWTNSGDTSHIITVSPVVDSTFNVIVSSGGCSADTSITIFVDTTAQTLSLLPQPSPTFCSGLSAILSVSGGGSGFTWSPSAGLNTTTGDSVLASPTITTDYIVTGSSSGGCAATGSILVDVVPAPPTPIITQVGDTLYSTAIRGNQWFYNGTSLNNDTSQSLFLANIADTGWYFVTVVNPANNCSAQSDSFHVTTLTGINQLSAISNQLSIYPNPFNNNIFIKINSSAQNIGEWTMQITDELGRTLNTKSSLNYSNEIDLSNLPGGVYFITIVNKTERAVFPVVKQN